MRPQGDDATGLLSTKRRCCIECIGGGDVGVGVPCCDGVTTHVDCAFVMPTIGVCICCCDTDAAIAARAARGFPLLSGDAPSNDQGGHWLAIVIAYFFTEC